MGFAKIGSEMGEQRVKLAPILNFTIGMFFDGTMNNQTNTDLGGKYSSDGSYANDYSNVARLSPYYTELNTETEKQFKIYVEGIGTRNKGRDSARLVDHEGGAFGTGETGIRAKVKKGCRLVTEGILKINKNNSRIGILTFDVFGFSRGSAAARNFVNEVLRSEEFNYINDAAFKDSGIDTVVYLSLKNGTPGRGLLGYFLKQAKIEVGDVKVRFIGLFETVSSYSTDTTAYTDFDDDVAQLHLDTIKRSQRVVHLIAADEHRENFALTNISRTGTNPLKVSIPGDATNTHTAIGPKSIQLSFPGVHSDIGGSYPDGFKEKITIKLTSQFKKEKLEADGWYNNAQFSDVKDSSIIGDRTISNKYSYILLHIMCEFAIQFKAGLFDQDKIENKRYFIPKVGGANNNKKSLLQSIKERLYLYAFTDNTKPLLFEYFKTIHNRHKNAKTAIEKAAYENEIAEQADFRVLRNKFLHWSSDESSTGMGANFEKDVPKRIIYDDNDNTVEKNKHIYKLYNQ